MGDVCRICLEAKDELEINVLEYVDIIENLVEIEVNSNLCLLSRILNHGLIF